MRGALYSTVPKSVDSRAKYDTNELLAGQSFVANVLLWLSPYCGYTEILMRRNPLSRPLRLNYRPIAVASALAVAGVAACSSVPDEANPVKWYEGVTSLIEDDDEIFGNDGPVEPAPGGDDPFPNLASVPDEPRPASDAEELDRVAEGLVADRDNAQYTDEVLRSRYADDTSRITAEAPQSSAPEPVSEPVRETVADAVTTVEQPIERVEVPEPAGATTVVAQSEYSPPPSRSSDTPTVRASDTAGATSGTIEAASTAVLAARDRNEKTARPEREVITEPVTQTRRTDAVARAAEEREERVEQSVARAERQVETVVRQAAPKAEPAPVAEQAPRREPEPQRVARAEPPANTGRAPSPRGYAQPLTLAGFKTLFNERFEASGRPPEVVPVRYQSGDNQAGARQVSNIGRDNEPLLGLADLTVPDGPVTSSAGSGISFQAANIQFSSGGAALSREAQGQLREVAALHKQYGGYVKVVGHSSQRTGAMDHTRHKLINFKLSVDRAQAVATALQRLGVESSALLVSGAGDNEPIAHEYMPEGEAANRRAEIFIQY